MRGSDITLQLRERRPADRDRGYVAADIYDIVADGETVGEISLRLVETDYLRLYGGLVGYRVDVQHRGHGGAGSTAAWSAIAWTCSIAAMAALPLLCPIARAAGFDALWITCCVDNPASRRTLEKAGAAFVEEIDLLPGTDMYERGQRRSCRFRLSTAGRTSRG